MIWEKNNVLLNETGLIEEEFSSYLNNKDFACIAAKAALANVDLTRQKLSK